MMMKKIKNDSKLYKFLNNGKSKEMVRFDEAVWKEAVEKLADLNDPQYFFEFEDRIINEIVSLASKLPRSKAKKEIKKVGEIIKEDLKILPHASLFFENLRCSIMGAVAVALNCLA